MLLKPLVDEFLHYLKTEKGSSHHTVTAYYYDLGTWLRHLDEQGLTPELESVTPMYVRSFVMMLSDAGMKPATIARRVNAIRSFWNYLIDCEYTEKNPCRRVMTPKVEQTLPVYLTEEEVNALLAATDKNYFTNLAFRDRAVLSLFVYTGIRRGELLALRLQDVDLDEKLLIVRQGKGKKDRVIPIIDPLAEALSDYLEFRPDAPHDRFFSTRDSRPLGRMGVITLFQKALKNSGITRKGVTIHKLRHTFATMLLKNGCDLVTIQKLMGHNSLETTSVYLHVDTSKLRGAVEKLNYLNG